MECGRGLAMRILPTVCLSVCPTVKRVNYDKTEEKSVHVLHHTKDNLAQFSEKKMVGGGRPLLSEILGQSAPVGAKSPILNR